MPERPVIVITGSRAGIGRALRRHFVNAGWAVIGCSRSADPEAGGSYHHVVFDVADESAVTAAFMQISDRFGAPDVLINNAGIMPVNYAVLTPAQAIREAMDINVLGTMLCCREAVKLMQARRRGHIINLSSVAVRMAAPGTSVYSASKAAVEQYSRVLRNEVQPFGIAVDVLSLSFVRGSGMAEQASEQAVEQTLRAGGRETMMELDEVIAAVEQLMQAAGTPALVSGKDGKTS